MKLMSNLDIQTDFTAKKAGQEVEFEVINECNYKSEELHYLAKDPVIDGLARFRHPDAPWSIYAENEAKELNEKWMLLLEEHDNGVYPELPSERMMNSTFQVFCWKDFNPLQAGETYTATIEDIFGFDTDGFVIYHNRQKVVVDTIADVINHFVLV